MRSVRHCETAVNRQFLRQHRGGNLVESRAAVFFRHAAAHQTDFAAFFHQLDHQSWLLVFKVLDAGKNFLKDKFFRRLADQLLIVRQVGRREHIARLRRFQEEAASLGCGLGESSGGHLGRS